MLHTTFREELRLRTLNSYCVKGCTDSFLSSAPWVSPPAVLSPSPSCPPGGLEPQSAGGNLCPGMPWIRGQLDSRVESNSCLCLFVYLPCHPEMRQLISKFLKNTPLPFHLHHLWGKKVWAKRGNLCNYRGLSPTFLNTNKYPSFLKDWDCFFFLKKKKPTQIV